MASRISLALKLGGGVAIFLLSFWATLQIIDFRGSLGVSEAVAVESKGGRSDSGWPKHTMRVVIPASAIRATGRGITIKFGAGNTRGLSIGKAYIGNGASDVPYHFEAPPVQLKFNGAPNARLGPGETILSDEAEFTIVSGKNLVVSFYMDDPANEDPIASPPMPGWASFFRSGDESGALRPTGFSPPRVSAVSHGVLQIKIRTPDR